MGRRHQHHREGRCGLSGATFNVENLVLCQIYRLIETTGLSRGEIKKWFSEQRLLNVKGERRD